MAIFRGNGRNDHVFRISGHVDAMTKVPHDNDLLQLLMQAANK